MVVVLEVERRKEQCAVEAASGEGVAVDRKSLLILSYLIQCVTEVGKLYKGSLSGSICISYYLVVPCPCLRFSFR